MFFINIAQKPVKRMLPTLATPQVEPIETIVPWYLLSCLCLLPPLISAMIFEAAVCAVCSAASTICGVGRPVSGSI